MNQCYCQRSNLHWAASTLKNVGFVNPVLKTTKKRHKITTKTQNYERDKNNYRKMQNMTVNIYWLRITELSLRLQRQAEGSQKDTEQTRLCCIICSRFSSLSVCGSCIGGSHVRVWWKKSPIVSTWLWDSWCYKYNNYLLILFAILIFYITVFKGVEINLLHIKNITFYSVQFIPKDLRYKWQHNIFSVPLLKKWNNNYSSPYSKVSKAGCEHGFL